MNFKEQKTNLFDGFNCDVSFNVDNRWDQNTSTDFISNFRHFINFFVQHYNKLIQQLNSGMSSSKIFRILRKKVVSLNDSRQLADVSFMIICVANRT